MTFWTLERVAAALNVQPSASVERLRAITTDTRTIAPGDLFVALRGVRFDAHDFLEVARDAGAGAAVVRRGTAAPAGLAVFEVDDTLAALGRLARARRRAVSGPVVAVTGTNGKTSTKEMIARALGVRWRVHATRENLNNEVGVPLTILSAPDDVEALVVEAGANLPGEIGRLRAIIEPSAAIVTNVAVGHIEGFGSLAGVLAEKVALLAEVPLAVVGPEPPELAVRARAAARRVIVAGLGPGADVAPEQLTLDAAGRARFTFRGIEVALPLVGRHQAANAILALALCEALEVDLAPAAAALSEVRLPPGRGEVVQHAGLTILHDAYNANPASFFAALATVAAMRRGRPWVAFVGTMRELGAESEAAHARIAAAIVEAQPAFVAAAGAFVPAFAPHEAALGDRLLTGDDVEALARRLVARLDGHEIVLLKASRGVRIERALPVLLSDREDSCSTTS